MASLYQEIHFWSCHDDIVIASSDFTSTKYLLRKDCNDEVEAKRSYFEKRGYKLLLPNKRPEKLRDKLQELEDALQVHTVVCYHWKDDHLMLMLSKGLIIKAKLSANGDLNEISLDKSLTAKIQLDVIVDGYLDQNQVVASCRDGKVMGYSDLSKEWQIESGFRRNVNLFGDWLVCWGKTDDHPQPWSPLAKDHQRSNIHLYWIGSRGPDLLSHKKTDGEPIKVIVSKKTPRSLILMEQKVSQKGSVSVEVSVLELVGSTLKRTMVTLVPLQTQACCANFSHNELFAIFGCIDGCIALLDRNRGTTRVLKTAFIPSFVEVHVSEALALVVNERGYMQYYDIALNPIASQMFSVDENVLPILDVSKYFDQQRIHVQSVHWGHSDVVLEVDGGPLVVVKHVSDALSLPSIVQLHLHAGRVDSAISLLLNWEFNEAAFSALQRIVVHVLRVPLNETTAKHLQAALGSFHSPDVPLSTQTRHAYGTQVKSLTRRFFHHLVRAKMFETAFLLAVDLGHHDLFMDLYHVAVTIGETEMAAAARAQASSILSQCSSEASNCSRSSCSQCLDSSSEDEGEKEGDANDFLSTNFNNPVPKTYKPAYVPPIPNIDLPKIRIAPKPAVQTPPLPFASYNHIGIPIANANLPQLHPHITPVPPPRVPALPSRCPSNTNVHSEPRFVPIGTIIAPTRMVTPPLPTLTSNPMIPQVHQPVGSTSPQTASGQVKKPQAKVKFSDTVTAFIVPEVKRPIRAPPPANVMDPQKELADSLPLCHPNEEYLKDFTPIRRDANDSPPPPQSKITVVHFGVV